jgi:ribosome recycling factor
MSQPNADAVARIAADVQAKMDKTVTHLADQLRTIRTGRAAPALVDGIRVDYYGTSTPLNQIAQISVPEARRC